MTLNIELKRLINDTIHYCNDHKLSLPFGVFKLIIVVDYWPVAHYRLLKYCCGSNNVFKLLLRVILLFFKPIVDGLSGCRIYIDSDIGGGLLLHQSTGVVISPKVVLGENCIFFSGACVVYKANSKLSAAPIIGNNVKLMVGSKVVGNVIVGDNAIVGANAVVLKDVPANSVAVGIPAKNVCVY